MTPQSMTFTKMHGLGNDFIIVDHRAEKFAYSAAHIARICDRNFGVGCDQFIVIEPSKNADIFMRIYNADGSQAEACGNATRCVAHMIMQQGDLTSCTIQTAAGVLPCTLVVGDHVGGDNAADNYVRVNMGAPHDVRVVDTAHMPAPTPISGVCVNMGNPHIVFVVYDAAAVNLADIGKVIEHDALFPNRTNVEFIHINDDGSVRCRVWERGAGITLACGSGACAVAVAAITQGLTGNTVTVHMDGGALTLEYDGQGEAVFMSGAVAYVFNGVFDAGMFF